MASSAHLSSHSSISIFHPDHLFGSELPFRYFPVVFVECGKWNPEDEVRSSFFPCSTDHVCLSSGNLQGSSHLAHLPISLHRKWLFWNHPYIESHDSPRI